MLDGVRGVGVKLSQLVANGWNVHVACHKPGCKRMRIIKAQDLLEQLGDPTLDELKTRLKCKCGERPGDVVARNDGARSSIRN